MKNTARGLTLWGVPRRTFTHNEVTQTVRNHRIPSRPHVQGSSAPIRLRHSSGDLTDGAGLVLLRRCWDALGIGSFLDGRTAHLGGRYRPSLMVEAWIALLFWGGEFLDHVVALSSRGVRRLFGWTAVPDATTFGRWLRRGGPMLVPLLDEVVWRIVQIRWRIVGAPRRVTLLLDSHVAVRYGLEQAGAEKGYNPKKPGRPSHHPLVAFIQETRDCLGVRWRPGSAGAAAGASEWVERLVGRLGSIEVEEITIRLDKGFFSKEMVHALTRLDVSFYLKVTDWPWVRRKLSAARQSRKDPTLWTRSAPLYGVRLLSVEKRERVDGTDGAAEPELELGPEAYEIKERAHVLTNVQGIHALTAWRRYNAGAVVEDRIEELCQMGAGRTAVDDIGGNRLLWQMAVLAYELFHVIRTTSLTGSGKRAQPKTLRLWLFRIPAKQTRSGGMEYVQPPRTEPMRGPLLRALRTLRRLRAPPVAALAA